MKFTYFVTITLNGDLLVVGPMMTVKHTYIPVPTLSRDTSTPIRIQMFKWIYVAWDLDGLTVKSFMTVLRFQYTYTHLRLNTIIDLSISFSPFRSRRFSAVLSVRNKHVVSPRQMLVGQTGRSEPVTPYAIRRSAAAFRFLYTQTDINTRRRHLLRERAIVLRGKRGGRRRR